MNISFNGIGCIAATFKISGSVNAGDAVKVTGNGTVSACASGDNFLGVAETVSEDGYARVKICGYTELEYTGTKPAFGQVNLVSDAAGKVKTGEKGKMAEVIFVDETDKTVGFFM